MGAVDWWSWNPQCSRKFVHVGKMCQLDKLSPQKETVILMSFFPIFVCFVAFCIWPLSFNQLWWSHYPRILFTDSIGSFGEAAPREQCTARWLTENPLQVQLNGVPLVVGSLLVASWLLFFLSKDCQLVLLNLLCEWFRSWFGPLHPTPAGRHDDHYCHHPHFLDTVWNIKD